MVGVDFKSQPVDHHFNFQSYHHIRHLLPPDLVIDAAIGLFYVHDHQDTCFFCYVTSFIPGTMVVVGKILESVWAVLNAVMPAMHMATLAH